MERFDADIDPVVAEVRADIRRVRRVACWICGVLMFELVLLIAVILVFGV